MKPRKNITLTFVLGLLLSVFTVVIAQTPSQGDQKKAPESCCSMESCCSGDSCHLKHEGVTTADGTAAKTDAKSDCCGDSCKMKKKDMNHADDQECCACCADSCDMKMKHDATMKHDSKMKHDMKGHKGDCRKAKTKKAA
jgi:hypothetical protein